MNFIEKLNELKNVGGNGPFERLLQEKIAATGKTLGELTIDEFLLLHQSANADFNSQYQRYMAA